MTTPTMKWEISLGSLLHMLAMIVTITLAYSAVNERTSALEREFSEMHRTVNRIEHYLQSNDRDYWKKIAENGDRDQP